MASSDPTYETPNTDEYAGQLAAGKSFIEEKLSAIAIELGDDRVKRFSWMTTERDFDRNEISLVEEDQLSVVAKFKTANLADLPTSSVVKNKLEDHLQISVRDYLHK